VQLKFYLLPIETNLIVVLVFFAARLGFLFHACFLMLFQVNGSLSYNSTIPDGFYLIHGMDPFVWSLCTDVQEENRIPSMESLKSVRPDDSSIQAILIDRRTDFELGMLESYASSILSSSADAKDVVIQLAKLISSRMG